MNLKVERVRNNMTQETLAKKSGVCRTLISKAENGDISKLNYESMEKLAKTLGVSIKYLFFKK